MKRQAILETGAAALSASEAERRIEDWFCRGYVMYSDRLTRSTHLRRIDGGGAGRVAPRPTKTRAFESPQDLRLVLAKNAV